ncbi:MULTISPECIES: hypothetical protein [Flammeovirga]|uniref:Lipoprotein n=1 Tax=Flammeovirga agarivorans TaxID=2726742 RepID=A0A7X8XTP7_9BACT|nr:MULTISPECIES: hypothetical protein [Flammeovirga]NLR89568.1 hypothetical protein [Flammeovirga agarivorans]
MISLRYITQFLKRIRPLLILLMLSSCFGEPEFPLEPEIEFAWIENYNSEEKKDSVYIAFTFKDGDGDLGLDPEDNEGPYAPKTIDPVNGDTIDNKYHNNYFVEVLRKEEDGTYQPVTYEGETNFNGRFPMLNTSGRDRPLEGELRYGIVLWFDGVFESPLYKGDSVKFNIHICDRALNESNEITTEGIEIGSPKRKEDNEEPPQNQPE